MSYVKQTWADGPTGGTPIDAARLQHIEDGLEAAATVADTAQAQAQADQNLALVYSIALG